MATKERASDDQKKMNATIKEDVFGEESMNTVTDMKKWMTEVIEDRSKVHPENKLNLGDLNYEQYVANQKPRSKLPFDKRIQDEYERIKAKDKMLREVLKESRQSVENRAIAQEEIAKFRIEIENRAKSRANEDGAALSEYLSRPALPKIIKNQSSDSIRTAAYDRVMALIQFGPSRQAKTD